MDFGSKILFFFSALGAFNGLLLSAYFIFFTPKKHLSNYLLGALLLVLSIRIGKSVVYYFDSSLPKIYLQFGLSACFLIGPFLYFFIKSETEQIRKMPKSWLWLIAFWVGLIMVVGIIYPYQTFRQIWWNYIIYAIYTQWGLHIAFSGVLLIPILKRVFQKENIKPFEKWLLTIWVVILILFFFYVWAILDITRGSYILGAVSFSLILYTVVFVLMYRKKANDLSSFSNQKYTDKKLNEGDARLMMGKLEKVMQEKEIFKNPNLKLNDLAKEINVSGHQLSQLLNDNLEKNFTLFINEYRINEACKILSTKPNLTIEAIGDEVGFNSKSTFFATFKKIKGMTPNLYQQLISPNL
ncbi:MAG: AraC family transcriptional regulator [Runella slithyformis]|nr:MAG: AraC family transcriptional regulator [Runella slithyformis]TAF27695.1 MAG: AraC family transcriptional regulator [Runella slithyformis]TAF44627.1 MAG: AraC family transcriptional regulator [Runella slithyformis]TAF80173.1 MAG: AraC family transcriptional regulator [Runella slithyformis]